MSRNHGRRTNPQNSKASKNADEHARCRFRLESPVRGPVLFRHLPRLSSQEGESTGFLQTDVIRVGGPAFSLSSTVQVFTTAPREGRSRLLPDPSTGTGTRIQCQLLLGALQTRIILGCDAKGKTDYFNLDVLFPSPGEVSAKWGLTTED